MSVADYYQKYWEGTEDVSDSDVTTPERKRKLLSILLDENLNPGKQVLDLGCGAGKFTLWMQEAGFQATGVDVSSNALEKARRTAPQCDFRLMTSEGRIPAEDNRFDAVWTTEVIEHVLDVSQFLGEIQRVLRPKGLLILTTPYHGLLKNLLIVLSKFDGHFDPEGSHIRFFDKRGLDRCLCKASFIPLVWDGIGRVWPLYRTWFVVARKR